MLVESPLDSRRFGLRVVRGRADVVDPDALIGEIDRLRADVAIVRFPAGLQPEVNRLARAALPIIAADMLVWYEADLSALPPRPPRNADLVIERLCPEDGRVLDDLVGRTFGDYASHYASNPLFPAEAVLDGYREWARAYCEPDGDESGRAAFVGRLGEGPVAFLTCCLSDEGGQVVLNGVVPEAAGRGVYGDMIRSVQAYFLRHGATRMRVSTQAGNIAVQKAWTREGLRLAEVLVTIHVNALLSASAVPPVEVRASWKDLSGDHVLQAIARESCPLSGVRMVDWARSDLGPPEGRFASVRVSWPSVDSTSGLAVGVVQARPSGGGPLGVLARATVTSDRRRSGPPRSRSPARRPSGHDTGAGGRGGG